MSELDDFNAQVIADFRANAGRVGGYFEGRPMVLVHTTGARSGRERVTPLLYRPEGDAIVIFAAKGGAPDNPDWYHNLLANPDVTVELGEETFPARATEVTGAERDRLYAAQATAFPQFAEYEQKTTRKIPVIVLERV